MTIVVAVKTTDSLVFASDSATTQQLALGSGPPRTASIWNSANKIVNLRKSWPIGAVTFGLATVQGRSIANHCKELRARLSGEIEDAQYPVLPEGEFTVEEVVDSLRRYFRALYNGRMMLGFLVGGFSAKDYSPEVWQVVITPEGDEAAQALPPGEAGILHQGVTDAITRLVDGAGQDLGSALERLGVPKDESEPAADAVRQMLAIPLAWPGMPLGETIDLARFLVDMTINFVRFKPGDATVGGPIEIAALTKHEGFKWVQRKHYYSPSLNPPEGAL